jgi:hypothetical protein
MSFNRTQSRAVTGLLTGHNTLRRHLYLLDLLVSPLCRRCGVREETSAQILCESEDLASLRHAHLGSFFLEPKDIQSISLGAIWSFSKASGLPSSDMGHKGPMFGLGALGPCGPEPKYNQSINVPTISYSSTSTNSIITVLYWKRLSSALSVKCTTLPKSHIAIKPHQITSQYTVMF